MKDQFKPKTWLHWAALLGCGSFAVFCLSMAIAAGTGALLDVGGNARPEAAIPLGIIGSVLAVFAIRSLLNLIALRNPLLRCYREGIECTMVGMPSIKELRYLPRVIGLMISIFDPGSYRAQQYWVNWGDFVEASVSGIPMAYHLQLVGNWADLRSGKIEENLTLREVQLTDSPQEIADALNHFKQHRAAKAGLRARPQRA